MVLFVFLCSAAFGKVSIEAKYREAGNAFDILDCVSGWWDFSFCNDGGSYQEEWKKRFSISNDDKVLFNQYDALRKKYFQGLGLPKQEFIPDDGIFAKRASLTEDLVAPAFYSSNSLDEAYSKLSKIIDEADLKFLQAFHNHFRPKLQTLLNESKAFKKAAESLNRELQDKRYQKFFKKVSSYYGIQLDIEYEVLFSWWPPIERDNASPTGQYLVLRKNPIKHLSWDDKDIVFHEVVHTISARQPQEKKYSLSKKFLENCPVEARMPRGHILEEPLAVAIGQIYFLSLFHPGSIRWESKLYSKPWISSFAKVIYPLIKEEIESGKKFSADTAAGLGKLCNEYLGAAETLKTAVK